ncbi:MAG: ATP-binding cassette domain-containing protein [Planctomycetia bacterium]|nr:ATP-binding cassette domain-containing protein [Planctomycetia bacterium]
MSATAAISIAGLSHRYGSLTALDGISFDVAAGAIFGLLGPNGGGKTTLFRILATLLPVQEGHVRLLDRDVAREPAQVRRFIGVTFQSPSLDRKLTVRENLVTQGRLYGIARRPLRNRIDELLSRLGLAERSRDRVESLSGGLARRVEIAKGLLHEPRVLLLDEPSTGLDPGARLDLWLYLRTLQRDAGVTVLVTTHLMEEAERCDTLAILDSGRIVALGSPVELRDSIGGDCLTIDSPSPAELAGRIAEKFHVTPRVIGPQLRIETASGHELLREVVEAFGPEISSVSLAKPTLEDVFVQRTGHKFWDESSSQEK